MGKALSFLTVILAVSILSSLPAQADQSADLVLFDPVTAEWHVRSPDGSITRLVFGEPGDLPLWGDWDCDGIDSAGLFRRRTGTVILRGPVDSGDTMFEVGLEGDVPLVGDWNGDGCDTVSMYRQDRVLVINELGGEVEDRLFFGEAGDVPIAGDFDGDGISSVGLFRSTTGRVYLTNTLDAGGVVRDYGFGELGDYVTVGDWDGDGIETLARFIPDEGIFLLSRENSAAAATDLVEFGEQHWIPPGRMLTGPRASARGRVLLLLTVTIVALASWALLVWSDMGSGSDDSSVTDLPVTS